MKFKKAIPYGINIEATINGGFIVTFGCVKLAYGDLKGLRKDLDEYLADPGKVAEEYKKAVPNQRPDQPANARGLTGQAQQRQGIYPGAIITERG